MFKSRHNSCRFCQKAAACTLTLADEHKIEALGISMKKTIEETKKQLLEKVPNMHSLREGETQLPRLSFGMANQELHHDDCDPFILFVRAAAVWSTIQNQMLLPVCLNPHDSCEECLAYIMACWNAFATTHAHGPGSSTTTIIAMMPIPK